MFTVAWEVIIRDSACRDWKVGKCKGLHLHSIASCIFRLSGLYIKDKAVIQPRPQPKPALTDLSAAVRSPSLPF